LVLEEAEFIRLKHRVKQFPKRLVNQSDVIELMICISAMHYKAALKPQMLQMIDFDDQRLRPSDYKTLTGLKKDEFDTIVNEQPLRQSKRWSRRNSLGIYLTRIKTGSSKSSCYATWCEPTDGRTL
jgi:hypothetical protein